MKLTYTYIKDIGEFQIKLVSESQKESAEIIEIADRIAAPSYSFGHVGVDYTYAWINIPLKKISPNSGCFGTRK